MNDPFAEYLLLVPAKPKQKQKNCHPNQTFDVRVRIPSHLSSQRYVLDIPNELAKGAALVS